MQDAITIEQVKASWEEIRRRIKGREHGGAMIAALLMECEPVRIEDDQMGSCVVIRSTVAFPVPVLRTSVNREVVAWGISQVMGQRCQVRIEPPEAAHGVQGEHDRLDLPAPRFVFPLDLPWCCLELKEHWSEVTRALARQPKDMLLAAALAQCVPVRLQMDEVPWLLVVRTSSPLAWSMVEQAALNGTLPVALLSILGHVCRVRVEHLTSEQRAS